MGCGAFFNSSRNRRCFYVWILLPVCCFSKLHNGSYYRSIHFTVTKTSCFKHSERWQRRCYWNFIGIHTAAKCSLVYPCRGFFLCYRHCKTRFWRAGKQYLESCPGSARLQVAYPAVINSDWRTLTQQGIHKLVHNIAQVDAEGKIVDAITRATPLAKEAGAETYRLTQLLMGNIPGCIGETSAIALLLGEYFWFTSVTSNGMFLRIISPRFLLWS